MSSSADDLFTAGMAKHRAGDFGSAASLYGEVLGLDPEHLAARHNLGLALQKLGRLDAALDQLGQAARRHPESVAPLYSRGNLLLSMKHLEAAEADFRALLALDPDSDVARTNLGHALIGQGRFEEGFAAYDFRPERLKSNARRLPFPEWQGEPLAGRKLYVLGEQGYGDQIMMARFLPGLQAMGAQTTFACLRPLHSLLGQVSPVGFFPTVDSVPAHDYWVASMSLPGRLGMRPETLPPAPFLRVPRAAAQRRPDPPAKSRPRIGFVWRGEPRNPNDANRSLASPWAFLCLEELGVEMVDLQTPDGDFADTAARIVELDLVMAVDTAMVHLAGALGLPCWALIPFLGADWRWPPGRTDTPWYGSVRVFHQPAAGDWDSVFAEIRTALPHLKGRT